MKAYIYSTLFCRLNQNLLQYLNQTTAHEARQAKCPRRAPGLRRGAGRPTHTSVKVFTALLQNADLVLSGIQNNSEEKRETGPLAPLQSQRGLGHLPVSRYPARPFTNHQKTVVESSNEFPQRVNCSAFLGLCSRNSTVAWPSLGV